MSDVTPPFGAETVDEVLVAYANGSLSEAERAEVDRWLAAHPAWRARLDAYGAIRGAVRTPPPADAARPDTAAPDIGGLTGLWAAIDAEAASPPPLPPPALPAAGPPPVEGGEVVSLDARRRRSRGVLAAAAAALLVVAGGAVALTRGSDDGQDSSSAEPPPTASEGDADSGGVAPPTTPSDGEAPSEEAPGDGDGPDEPNPAVPRPTVGEPGVVPTPTTGLDAAEELPPVADEQATRERMAEVVQAVADTRAAATARVTTQSVSTFRVDGTQWEDDNGGEANVYGTGEGVVLFDQGWAITADLDNPDGRLWPDPVEGAGYVELADGDLAVRCPGGGLDATADPDTTGCALGTGISPFSLFAVLDLLAAGDGRVVRAGTDPEGLDGYIIDATLPVDGQDQEVQVHVYADPDEGVIRYLRVYLADGVVAPVSVGGAVGEPAEVDGELLWLNLELTDHGADVELTDGVGS